MEHILTFLLPSSHTHPPFPWCLSHGSTQFSLGPPRVFAAVVTADCRWRAAVRGRDHCKGFGVRNSRPGDDRYVVLVAQEEDEENPEEAIEEENKYKEPPAEAM